MHKRIPIQTEFANISIAANAILHGPKDIVVSNLKGQKFYGWPNLTVEVRDARTVRIESRSVYANLFDTSQKSAILRAVYWDGLSARKAFKEQTNNNRVVLPARFVVVSTQRLRTWLSQFHDLDIRVSTKYDADKTTDVRRLRIESNYVSQIFEKVWQRQDPQHTSLNERWNRVWRWMTESLHEESVIEGIIEDFWFVNPEVHYDLRTYQPGRYAPQ
jgi:hypothetical protein